MIGNTDKLMNKLSTILVFSMCCNIYLTAQNVVEVVDSLPSDTIGLKEVSVTARKVKHYVDRDEYLLSHTDREHGSNALDAISSLPAFNISLNDTKLTTRDNREVIILIDGRETDGMDLRTSG